MGIRKTEQTNVQATIFGGIQAPIQSSHERVGPLWFPEQVCRMTRPQLILVMLLLTIAGLVGCGELNNRVQPLPWPKQLESARKVAMRRDPSAVLTEVIATPGHAGSYQDHRTLDVTFGFVQRSGVGFRVGLKDTDPQGTAMLLEDRFDTELPDGKALQHFQEALAAVQVSPAEALSETLEEGTQFATEERIRLNPQVDLHRSERVAQVYGTPAVWRVFYWAPPQKELVFIVDARTGRILRRASDSKVFPGS